MPHPVDQRFPFVVISDTAVRITVYGATGSKLGVRDGAIVLSLPRGLYRIHLSRCGIVRELFVDHRQETTLHDPGPPLRTPTPLAGAATSHGYYRDCAQRLSLSETCEPLGDGPHTARLFIFIRRKERTAAPLHIPSEPVTVHDASGHTLTNLCRDTARADRQLGYIAFSARVTAGTYRIRAARSRRDVAITIPANRSAHIFVPDSGAIHLDDLRASLIHLDRPFDPDSQIARAMESLIAALRSPEPTFPPDARLLLSAADDDLYFALAAVHQLLRCGEDDVADQITARLARHAEIPDIAILKRVRSPSASATRLPLDAPPLLRASLVMAMTHPGFERFDIAPHSSIARAAATVFQDSIWCTWSNRAWDERWIEPTIVSLRALGHGSSAASIAKAIALPRRTVERAIRCLDSKSPVLRGEPVQVQSLSIPGYLIGDVIGRGAHGTVLRATRAYDNRPVALKVIPLDEASVQLDGIKPALEAMRQVGAHPNLLGFDHHGTLSNGMGLWFDMELCQGSVLGLLSNVDNPLKFDRTCQIVLQALDGLAYLHDRGIVHGNINPAKLLIRLDGSVAIASAYPVTCASRASEVTEADSAHFLPREQLVDVSDATTASDVWSMAATLYFLLTLDLPRDVYGNQSELEAAFKNAVVSIEHRHANVPHELARCIDRALSEDVQARPKTARELCRHLTAALDLHALRPGGLAAAQEADRIPRSRTADAVALTLEQSPYRGFLVYEEQHAELFHGRRAATELLRQQVERQPITVVIGSSGVGKSSLVRAGLVPGLRNAHPEWQILAPIRPGTTPLATLDAALAARRGSGTAVLVVDQLEELFARPDPFDERTRFLAKLLETSMSGDLYIVGTMNAELETELWSSPLGKTWELARFVLHDMAPHELREAIEMPAQRRCLTFEPPEMVDRLIDAVTSIPDALPLLSFTLQKLYVDCVKRADNDRRLIESSEIHAGSFALALHEYTERLLSEFDDATRDTLRRMLLRMVSSNAEVIARQQLPLAELEFTNPQESTRVLSVLDALTGYGGGEASSLAWVSDRNAVGYGMLLIARTVTPNGDFVELAHAAIVREWPLLRTWLRDASGEDLALQRAVTASATQWVRESMQPGYLWHDDPRLALAQSRLLASPHQLNQFETAFVMRSVEKSLDDGVAARLQPHDISGSPGEGLLSSERDFYRRLLDLGAMDEIEPLLDEALALIVEMTGASTAYLELYEDEANRPRFWKGFRSTDRDIASIRASISRGIIARAIGEGRTIETASATQDVRFSEYGSVRQNLIQAVLCAPVGVQPPIGVMYLQGRTRPGMFTSMDRERAELFARQLVPLADRLVRHSRDDRVDYTREVRERLHCPEIIGRSKALAQLLQSALHAAPLDVDVLITGPSGAGKSLLARTLHLNSPRSSRPFVELNCAAIPDALIENELFGGERGAHATALRRVTGKVAAAEGGTLFLEEVAELTAGAQAKLLQLLETREYHALGSTTSIRADVRILSATNAKLEKRVSAKQFREDLYYRMHVVSLEVPGLGERRDDIPELVEHFCAEFCKRHHFPVLAVSRHALEACRDSPWPGHARQLAHAIEAAVIRAHGERSTTLHEHHIFPKLSGDEAEVQTLQLATREFQRRHVLQALEENDWNVTETARQLDLARSHLYNLINDFELRRKANN